MWTPLQMEMLEEMKHDTERAGDEARHVREAASPATRRQTAGGFSAAAAAGLRRMADRLDPAPLRRARTTDWASG